MALARQGALRDAETPLFSIRLRRRLHQSHDPLLAEAVQVSLCVYQRTFADTSIFPEDFPRIKPECGQDGAGITVEYASHQDGTTVVIFHVLIEIDLFCPKSIAITFDFQQRTTRPVVGGNEHAVAVHNRRGDIGGAV